MKKNNNGFVGIDIIISIVAITIFSGLIISLMYNNYLANVKLKKYSLATIYLTETLENVGIATYSEITEENIENIIPEEAKQNNYNIDLVVTTDFDLPEATTEGIMKKVTATISYKVANKEYKLSMERIKIKE